MINLYFIDYFNQLNNNGLNTYTTQLLGEFSLRQDIRVTAIWINSTLSKNVSTIIEGGISHMHFPKVNERELDSIIVESLITDFGSKEKIVVHLNWINHSGIAWHLKQKSNIKIVLTKHCLPWRDLLTNDYSTFYALNLAYENGKKTNINHPQLKREILGYNWIDHVITVTKSAKYSLTHLFDIDPQKISVIYNGLNPDTFKEYNILASKAILKKKYGFNPNEKIILYAGKITYSKGILDLVKIFDNISNTKGFKKIRLVVAGEGSHNQIFTAIDRSFGKITVTGNLNKNTLYDFLKMSDIGVIPSFTEQCSYSCIEMMYSGLPLIVSDIDGLKELISNDRGLKISLDFEENKASINEKDFTEKLRSMLVNKKEAENFALSAKEFAEKNLTSSRMSFETISVYEQVLRPSKIKKCELYTESIHGPLVSIIMPCYNSSKYLKDSLDSIFRQTYSNFELILINDGSTDLTDSMVREIQDSRLVYLKNISNKGITYSLNKTIRTAKGKYIIRMDADDIMEKNRLHKQIRFMEDNPEFGMSGSAYTIIDEQGMPINTVNYSFDHPDFKILLLFFNPFAHPTIAIRSEIAKRLLYDKNFLHCEDYELWFRIAKQSKVNNLPDKLMQYRVHSQNTSLRNNVAMKRNVINLLSRELEKLGIEHSTEELVIHGAISFGYGSKYFNNPEKILALKNWLNKIFTSPSIKKQSSECKIQDLKNYILNNCGVR
jgi:glycosyltransferase involved in cell wall biosynthesis